MAHGGGDIVGIPQGCALGKPCPIGIVPHAVAGDLDRQARLAAATRSGERHQAVGSYRSCNCSALYLATDEARTTLGEVRSARRWRAQRSEIRPQTGSGQLEDARRGIEVLEPKLAQLAEGEVVRRSFAHHRRHGTGDQDLPSMADRGDARGTMDLDADVVAVADDRLTDMQSHPDADLGVRRPLLAGQRTLAFGGGEQCLSRAGERDEERVPLGTDLVARMTFEGLPEEGPMAIEEPFVVLRSLLGEPG